MKANLERIHYVLFILFIMFVIIAGVCIFMIKPNKTEYSTIDIYNTFKEADLPVGEFINYDKNTDPNNLLGKQGQYIAKLNYYIEDSECSIEIFSDKKEAIARKKYIDDIGAAAPIFAESSHIVNDVILLRFDRTIDDEIIEKFIGILKGE